MELKFCVRYEYDRKRKSFERDVVPNSRDVRFNAVFAGLTTGLPKRPSYDQILVECWGPASDKLNSQAFDTGLVRSEFRKLAAEHLVSIESLRLFGATLMPCDMLPVTVGTRQTAAKWHAIAYGGTADDCELRWRYCEQVTDRSKPLHSLLQLRNAPDEFVRAIIATKPSEETLRALGKAVARNLSNIGPESDCPIGKMTVEQFNQYFGRVVSIYRDGLFPRDDAKSIFQEYLSAQVGKSFDTFDDKLAFAKMVQDFANSIHVKFKCPSTTIRRTSADGESESPCEVPANFGFGKSGKYLNGAFYFRTPDTKQRKHCHDENVPLIQVIDLPVSSTLAGTQLLGK